MRGTSFAIALPYRSRVKQRVDGDRRRMKILWIKAGGLVPFDTGGKIRSYQILRGLADDHEVTFFTFYAAHANDAHGDLARVFAHVECIPLPLPARSGVAETLHYARHIVSPLPYTMAKYYHPEVRTRLNRLVQSRDYDVIVCDFIYPAGILPWDLPCPKVLFTHNVEALIWKRHFQVAANPVWKAICWREYRKMARAERTYLQKSDHVLAVSATDRDFFARYVDPARISVIPTGVDLEYFSPAPDEEREDAIVFTGSMDWMANEDGVRFFVRDILPRIRREVPGATFWVVGRNPSTRVQALDNREAGVRVTGTVDDIRPYLNRGSVYVVPLRVGSGTRLKIFEAMATGKAIVSTTIGAEGLPVKHQENILLADDPHDFAGQVISLLRDCGRRRALGRASRQLVEERYSWKAAARQCETILTTLVGTPETRPAELQVTALSASRC
jgi:sugar transferase (PEP-CTERM/EpsH1 system associated)